MVLGAWLLVLMTRNELLKWVALHKDECDVEVALTLWGHNLQLSLVSDMAWLIWTFVCHVMVFGTAMNAGTKTTNFSICKIQKPKKMVGLKAKTDILQGRRT